MTLGFEDFRRVGRERGRVLPVAPLVAVVAITLIVASIIGAGRAQILEAGPRLVLAVFSLRVFGFLVGYAAGKGLLGSEIAARIDRGRNVELGARSGAGATALREPAGGDSERPLQCVPLAGRQPRGGLVATFGTGIDRAETALESVLWPSPRPSSRGLRIAHKMF